jgi:hypothetical protein
MAQLLAVQFITTRELGAGMVNVTPLSNHAPTAGVSALTALQHAFAISLIGGQLRLVDRRAIQEAQQGSSTAEVHLIKKDDGKMILRRFIESLPIPVVKPTDVVNNFWVSPNTIEYHRLAFHPIPQPLDTLNLWVPHTVEPAQGSWTVIEDYLVDVICDGGLALFDYLIRFLAHALKHPEEKPGIMIVLIGAEGAGKGFFVRLLEALWGATTLQVSDIAAVTGNFNAALQRAFWVALDECMFKGDKKSQDRMKSLVTEPTCPFYGHGFVISKLFKSINIIWVVFKRHRFFKCLKFGYCCEFHIFFTYLSFRNTAYSNHFCLATLNKGIPFRDVSIKGFLIDNFFNMINPITLRHFISPL